MNSRNSDGRRTAVVIFGASGSLATTRLMPAIEKLRPGQHGAHQLFTVGVDVKSPSAAFGKEGLAYVRGDLTRRETYDALSELLRLKVAGSKSDCTYYLATPPQLFPRVVEGLEEAGLDKLGVARRIIVEKPFGTDLGSSRALQRQLDHSFGRARVFRADHFLAKVGVREILRVRRASPDLEAALNGDAVDSVQIVADENSGVEARAGFYDRVGVMRDMVQNHLLHVLCQVATELPPVEGSSIQDEVRAELLKRIVPLRKDDVVWGQYSGYRLTKGAKTGSKTPTFVALRLSADTSRWRGVPFYIRTGKKLRRDLTKAVVIFKEPVSIRIRGRQRRLGIISFEVDPRAGVAGELGRSVRGGNPSSTSREVIRKPAPQDEYELLLRGALGDDHALFAGDRFNDLAWRIVDPPIRELEAGHADLRTYAPGTDGPAESERLLSTSGRSWQ